MKDILLCGGVMAATAVIICAIMVPPTDPAFRRVALFLACIGFFAGACFAEIL